MTITTSEARPRVEQRRSVSLRRFYLEHRALFRGMTSVIVLMVGWEITARTVFKHSLAIAAPSAVFHEYVKLIKNGQLGQDIQWSAQEFVYGFIMAAVVGLFIGLFMGAFRAVREYLDPIVNAMYATPVIALGPLFILWLGIGINSKIAVVFILAVLPIIINTETGIRTVDPHLLETARAFSASKPQMFRKIMLPASLPLIVTGLRLGVGRGLLGVVAGELFAAQHGLGYRILFSSQLFNPAGVFVGITSLAFAGILSMVLLRRLEKKLAPWRTEEDN